MLNKRNGTAILPVVLPDSGKLSLGGKGISADPKRTARQARRSCRRP